MRVVVEPPAAALSGRVLDEEGRPVENALVAVTLLEEDGEPKPYGGVSVRTASGGGFAVPRLPAGEAEVAAQHPGFETAWRNAALLRGAGATVELRLRKSRGGRAEGSP